MTDHRHQLDSKLSSLMRMVVEDSAKTKLGLDSLYRRLVTLIVLRSGLGNPTDAAVIQEANSCLATVFPVSQLVAFQSLARMDKKTKIRQLSNVVKGLRIYNWDCGRGGAGVDHLPSILNSAAEATNKNLANLDNYAREKGYKITAAFEKLVYTEAGLNASAKDIDQVVERLAKYANFVLDSMEYCKHPTISTLFGKDCARCSTKQRENCSS